MNIKYYNFDELDSTNDVAIKELQKIDDTNTAIVVTTNIQTQGRGRNNKVWFNGENNLYYTFGIKHSIAILPIYLMQVIGGLSVYEPLNDIISNKKVKLKYPNDIYVLNNGNPKKISGIISEHTFKYNDICSSIIGIGINNKQKDFPTDINAISLYNLDLNVDNTYLKEQLTKNIIKLINTKKEIILKLWTDKLGLYNKKIKIIDNNTLKEIVNEFRLKKILEDCRLLVIDNEGNERIIDNGDSIRYDLK